MKALKMLKFQARGNKANGESNINPLRSKAGMELVQVAILIGIAVVLGLVFKNQITEFVNGIFGELNAAKFTK